MTRSLLAGASRGRKSECNNHNVPIQIVRNEVPQAVHAVLEAGIFSAIGGRTGLWEVDITSELAANAWDVEIFGPNNFHWARRFSAEGRDTEVIAEAVHAAVLDLAA